MELPAGGIINGRPQDRGAVRQYCKISGACQCLAGLLQAGIVEKLSARAFAGWRLLVQTRKENPLACSEPYIIFKLQVYQQRRHLNSAGYHRHPVSPDDHHGESRGDEQLGGRSLGAEIAHSQHWEMSGG